MKITVQLTEAQEQALVIEWAQYNPQLKWLHAIPNGGSRHKAEAANLKRQGVKSGVADLFLPLPRRKYQGLYIEMKRVRGGTVSKEQREFLRDMSEQGYKAVVCRGHKEAIEAIKEYIEGAM